VFEVFKDNLDGILNGTFDKDLLCQIEDYRTLQEIRKQVEKYIYQSREILEIEAAGFEIVGKLLDEFVAASKYCKACKNESEYNKKSEKYNALLPLEFKRRIGEDDDYYSFLDVGCYVAGMSDTYALDMYHKITGMSMR